jgi:hypothetical protein
MFGGVDFSKVTEKIGGNADFFQSRTAGEEFTRHNGQGGRRKIKVRSSPECARLHFLTDQTKSIFMKKKCYWSDLKRVFSMRRKEEKIIFGYGM